MRHSGIMLCASLALVPTTPAVADDVQLDSAAITAALTDHVFTGEDKGRKTEQIFQKSGTTYYSVDGSQSQGSWQVRGDQFCSQWPPNQSWTCYGMVSDGNSITFVAASGKRYRVTRSD